MQSLSSPSSSEKSIAENVYQTPTKSAKPTIKHTPFSGSRCDSLSTPREEELSNSLINLKSGFRQREEQLQDQLAIYKEAVIELYKINQKLRASLNQAGSAVFDQMEVLEETNELHEEQYLSFKGINTEYTSLLATMKRLDSENAELKETNISLLQQLEQYKQNAHQVHDTKEVGTTNTTSTTTIAIGTTTIDNVSTTIDSISADTTTAAIATGTDTLSPTTAAPTEEDGENSRNNTNSNSNSSDNTSNGSINRSAVDIPPHCPATTTTDGEGSSTISTPATTTGAATTVGLSKAAGKNIKGSCTTSTTTSPNRRHSTGTSKTTPRKPAVPRQNDYSSHRSPSYRHSTGSSSIHNNSSTSVATTSTSNIIEPKERISLRSRIEKHTQQRQFNENNPWLADYTTTGRSSQGGCQFYIDVQKDNTLVKKPYNMVNKAGFKDTSPTEEVVLLEVESNDFHNLSWCSRDSDTGQQSVEQELDSTELLLPPPQQQQSTFYTQGKLTLSAVVPIEKDDQKVMEVNEWVSREATEAREAKQQYEAVAEQQAAGTDLTASSDNMRHSVQIEAYKRQIMELQTKLLQLTANTISNTTISSNNDTTTNRSIAERRSVLFKAGSFDETMAPQLRSFSEDRTGGGDEPVLSLADTVSYEDANRIALEEAGSSSACGSSDGSSNNSSSDNSNSESNSIELGDHTQKGTVNTIDVVQVEPTDYTVPDLSKVHAFEQLCSELHDIGVQCEIPTITPKTCDISINTDIPIASTTLAVATTATTTSIQENGSVYMRNSLSDERLERAIEDTKFALGKKLFELRYTSSSTGSSSSAQVIVSPPTPLVHRTQSTTTTSATTTVARASTPSLLPTAAQVNPLHSQQAATNTGVTKLNTELVTQLRARTALSQRQQRKIKLLEEKLCHMIIHVKRIYKQEAAANRRNIAATPSITTTASTTITSLVRTDPATSSAAIIGGGSKGKPKATSSSSSSSSNTSSTVPASTTTATVVPTSIRTLVRNIHALHKPASTILQRRPPSSTATTKQPTQPQQASLHIGSMSFDAGLDQLLCLDDETQSRELSPLSAATERKPTKTPSFFSPEKDFQGRNYSELSESNVSTISNPLYQPTTTTASGAITTTSSVIKSTTNNVHAQRRGVNTPMQKGGPSSSSNMLQLSFQRVHNDSFFDSPQLGSLGEIVGEQRRGGGRGVISPIPKREDLNSPILAVGGGVISPIPKREDLNSPILQHTSTNAKPRSGENRSPMRQLFPKVAPVTQAPAATAAGPGQTPASSRAPSQTPAGPSPGQTPASSRAPGQTPAGSGQTPAPSRAPGQTPADPGQTPALSRAPGQTPAGASQTPAPSRAPGQTPAGASQTPAPSRAPGQTPAGATQTPAGPGQMPAGSGQTPVGPRTDVEGIELSVGPQLQLAQETIAELSKSKEYLLARNKNLQRERNLLTSKLQNIIERNANFNETNENDMYDTTNTSSSSGTGSGKTMNIIATFIENNNILLQEIDTLTTQYNARTRQYEEQTQELVHIQTDMHILQQYNTQLTTELQESDILKASLQSDRVDYQKQVSELTYNNIILTKENQKLKEKMSLYQY